VEEEGNFLRTSNRVVLSGTRKEIIDKINENKNSRVFFLKTKPSTSLFLYLLNNTKIEKLILLPSIKKTIPKKVLDALKKSRIIIRIKKMKTGRPLKIDIKRFEKIAGKNMKDKRKIEKLKISRRAFYYNKKKIREINFED